MSSIIRQKVGNYVYLYESISYRNEDGKPRNRRVPIGKIDPQTGREVFKPEYLERLEGTEQHDPQPEESFTKEEIQQSTIRSIGAFHLYKALAERSGLLKSLRDALPNLWRQIFTLATYLVTAADPFAYCQDWLTSTESFSVGQMTSQRISELMTAITEEQRNAFYQHWCSLRSEQEYLALDITSVSSYSEFIDSVEWGYNRDGESLPQINICMLMGYQSRLPIYQSIYSGSLKDVSTLQTTLKLFHNVNKDGSIVVIMDKGFFSTSNVNAMLSEQSIKFLIAIPFTSKFAINQVNRERKDIDTLANTIVTGGDSFRAVTKLRRWNSDHQVYTHIFYNARKAQGIRESLYAHVASLRDFAIEHPHACIDNPDYTKYLMIRRSERNESGYTVNLREDVVEAELKTAGWLVVISNCVSHAHDAIRIYRDKDVVEKGFFRLKNSLDLGRLRVHGEASMRNKVFIGFIALILLSLIHQGMLEQGLYDKMTMKKLLLILSKVKVQYVRNTRILFPLTKEQRSVFGAFSVDPPV